MVLDCWLHDISWYILFLDLSDTPHFPTYSGLGIFFSLIAFSYLRQMLDPSSSANVIRGQRSDVYPSHYNPPRFYPAPPGPPPSDAYPGPPDSEYTKPPGYTGDGWDTRKKNHDEESIDETDVATGDRRY